MDAVRRLREKIETDVQNILTRRGVGYYMRDNDDQLKQFVMSSNLCILITVWVLSCGSLMLENRRVNIKLRQLNAKIKDLIAGVILKSGRHAQRSRREYDQ